MQPQNPMYTQLGVLTKGTIIEVNVSELGIVTAGGKVVCIYHGFSFLFCIVFEALATPLVLFLGFPVINIIVCFVRAVLTRKCHRYGDGGPR